MPVATDHDSDKPMNPILRWGRDPKARTDKSTGDKGATDAMLLVVAAWLVLFGLAYSLRHHNH